MTSTASRETGVVAVAFVVLFALGPQPTFAGRHDSPPLTEEQLKGLPLSGVAYYESLRAIGRLPKPSPPTPPPPIVTRFLDPSVHYNQNATFDGNQDVEPAIGSFNYGSQPTAVIASTKYVNVGGATVPRLYSSTTTDFLNFVRTPLPMPSTYVDSGDPYVGSYGSTVYVSGNLFNGASTVTPNAIALWRSTNGGTCWPSCQPSDTPLAMIENSSTDWYMDKPAIAVNQSSNVLAGRVYVAYAKVNNGNGALTELRLARYTGGSAFDSDIPLVYGRNTGAQVVVPPDGTGTIYVVYTSFPNRQLRMVKAVDLYSGGLVLVAGSDEQVTGSRNLIVGGDHNLTGGVQAWSLPSAKWNTVSGRIDVVWHERESANPDAFTDIFMTSKAPGGAWLNPFQLCVHPDRDQFMPALANHGVSGYSMITFYDRYDDNPGDTWYRPYFVYYTDLGTLVQGDTPMTTELYDPSAQPTITGFLGDYQDASYWTFSAGNLWNSVWIRTAQSDVVVTGIW